MFVSNSAYIPTFVRKSFRNNLTKLYQSRVADGSLSVRRGSASLKKSVRALHDATRLYAIAHWDIANDDLRSARHSHTRVCVSIIVCTYARNSKHSHAFALLIWRLSRDFRFRPIQKTRFPEFGFIRSRAR